MDNNDYLEEATEELEQTEELPPIQIKEEMLSVQNIILINTEEIIEEM